jgi:hypothetical protein
MPPRAPGVHTHEEWKGMAQPVGLVVEPVVLNRLGIFPESATTVLADWQQRLEQLLEDQTIGEQWLSVAPSFELFCQEVLAWQPGDLRKPEELPAPPAVQLDDYDEVLRPDWIVSEPSQGDGPLKAQLLVQELPVGTLFDALPKGAGGRRTWEATPQQRLERLLKESEHPIGLLWNGVALRLVYAPRGESSGHLTFPLEPMTTVDGRPMLAALQMLLGPDRLFEGGASNTRLRPLMEQSRKEQNEVSTRLAEQVLEALWILLRGFDAAGLQTEDPSHIYGGLITVLLRLVFLLYAEDEELMPTDSLYGQHYSVGGLALRLRQDRADYQNAMEGRRGAWATLLSLFRLVYDGGGSTEAYLTARHGDLFDPDAYPFLEGRTAGTSYTDGPLASVPAISDDVVEQVLTKLLLLDGQILSYRALDVEQIGSVYEGIMGFMVEKATGPSVGITHKPPRQKITITVVVKASELLAQPASKREKWLKDATGVDLKLGDKVRKGLRTASTMEDLCHALDKRLSKHTPRGGFLTCSLILQPTAERRRSGSHYTPRFLTEPIVSEAFRPWLHNCHNQPTAQQILALKVCDPAMGSGAFLVAVCRFLAEWLVEAWERDGYPTGFPLNQDKDTVARRVVAQRCLYGVDKNPFAVGLAKLSLWLVTLSKELPFTFIDHSLKCGDSLVGLGKAERDRLESNLHSQGNVFSIATELDTSLSAARRISLFHSSTDKDDDYDRKKTALQDESKHSNKQILLRDILCAIECSRPDKAQEARQAAMSLNGKQGDIEDASIDYIRSMPEFHDFKPFHWDIEFPEVFEKDNPGFDIVVGNPPYLGGARIWSSLGNAYPDWLRSAFANSGGKAVDLVAYFFRRGSELTAKKGTYSFIATKTISEGDTRDAGIDYLTKAGDTIYSVTKRKRWPGAANVIVSVVHAIKQGQTEDIRLNGRKVPGINSYFLPTPIPIDPQPLSSNEGIAFRGTDIYGEGFVFADDGKDQRAGTIAQMEDIIKRNPLSSHLVEPYIGGKELNTTPLSTGHRFVINLTSLSLNEASKHKDLFEIAREKVKPHRDTLGGYAVAEKRRELWWQFGNPTPALDKAKAKVDTVMAISQTTSHICFAVVSSRQVFGQKAIVLPCKDIFALFSILHSGYHRYWAQLLGATQGEGFVYSPVRCFKTFPFPLLDESSVEELASLGREYEAARKEFCLANSCGLTEFYNRYNLPHHADTRLSICRKICTDIELLLERAYSFDSVELGPTGFSAEVETDDSFDLVGEIGSDLMTDQGFIFIPDSERAAQIAARIEACLVDGSAVNWHYGWHPETIDEVLSRLVFENDRQKSAPISTASCFFNVESIRDSAAWGDRQISLDLFSNANG